MYRCLLRVPLLVGALVVSMLALAVGVPFADAAPAPVAQPVSSMVGTTALPTAQIDGVVWTQLVVGDTVYAGGNFTSARPPGAAPGTNTVARWSLLAYNLRTGQLTSFAPRLNGQVRALAVSPDQSRLYVGGNFTVVNGQPRYRMAAFTVATGGLAASFAPVFNASVLSIAATASTVYAGGNFTLVNGVARSRMASLRAGGAALGAWHPSANTSVNAMVLVHSPSRVVIGGSFTVVDGTRQPGTAAIDPVTSKTLAWSANTIVKDGGTSSGVTSLTTSGSTVYGTGYELAGNGNFEGTFAVNGATGRLVWMEDCHGDTYSSYVASSVIYLVGHAHYCQTVGGFPQDASQPHRALAFGTSATGTLLANTEAGYASFAGRPCPRLLNWFPDLTPGTFTGMTQAAWSVTGASGYLLLGGEFTDVNGVAQQGLVRLATRSIARNTTPPALSGADWTPSADASGAHQVSVSVPANWDQDSLQLNYRLDRVSLGFTAAVSADSFNGAPVLANRQADATFWDRPTVTLSDPTAVPGQRYAYRVVAVDPDGNTATSAAVTITVPSAPSTSTSTSTSTPTSTSAK